MHFLNKLLSYWPCHRIPDRCILIGRFRLAICARCSGLLVSIPIGIVLGLIDIFPSRWFAVPLLVPLLVDTETQRYGRRISNNVLRLLTGFLFGIGIGIYFYLWLVNDMIVLLKD